MNEYHNNNINKSFYLYTTVLCHHSLVGLYTVVFCTGCLDKNEREI